MKNHKLKLCACIALVVISPFIYILIQGYTATFHMPSIVALEIKSKVGFASIIVVESLFGSLVFGVLVSMPIGYMARKFHLWSSIFIFMVVSVFLLVVRSSLDIEEYKYSGFIHYGELVFLLLSIVFTGYMGYLLQKYGSDAAT